MFITQHKTNNKRFKNSTFFTIVNVTDTDFSKSNNQIAYEVFMGRKGRYSKMIEPLSLDAYDEFKGRAKEEPYCIFSDISPELEQKIEIGHAIGAISFVLFTAFSQDKVLPENTSPHVPKILKKLSTQQNVELTICLTDYDVAVSVAFELYSAAHRKSKGEINIVSKQMNRSLSHFAIQLVLKKPTSRERHHETIISAYGSDNPISSFIVE
jgi:hypothetical protein